MKSWGYNAVEKFATQPENNEYGWNVWKGKFSGTVAGCNCVDIPSIFLRRDGVQSGLHAHQCSYNETRDGCDDIDPIPAKNITRFPESGELYFKEIPKSSFFDLYQNMETDGSCKPGMIKCGEPESLGRGLCVPDSWKSCPISEVWINGDATSTVPNATKVSLPAGRYLWYASNPRKQPINEFKIMQSHVCSNPSLVATSKDRAKYVLDAGKTGKCLVDKRYSELESAPERILFQANNLQRVLKLPDYEAKEEHLWRRFFRSPIPWSPTCLDLVPMVKTLYKELKWFSKWSNMMYWMTLVGTIVLIILNWAIYRAIVDNDGIDVRLKWMNMRGVVIVVVAALYVYEWYRSGPVLESLQRISTQKCSDSYVETGLTQAWRAVKSSRFFYALWMIMFITNFIEASWNRMRARSYRQGGQLNYVPDRTKDSVLELSKFFAFL